jgi:hypothetical protein
MSSPLQTKFLADFAEQELVTTKQVYDWYCSVKQNPNTLPHKSAVFSLLINPLLHCGALTKLASGLYRITASTKAEPMATAAPARRLPALSAGEDFESDDQQTSDSELLGPQATPNACEADDWDRYIQAKLKGG